MTDRISLPPATRSFESPSGRFRLSIGTEDGWQTRHAIGELQDLKAPVPLRWRRQLPQTYGPRHALVVDTGEAVLIDDWINIPSPHALVLIGPDGETRAVHSIDAVIAALGVPRGAVAAHGRLGIWLSAMPVLSGQGTHLVFSAAGRHLRLSLVDGGLTAVD